MGMRASREKRERERGGGEGEGEGEGGRERERGGGERESESEREGGRGEREREGERIEREITAHLGVILLLADHLIHTSLQLGLSDIPNVLQNCSNFISSVNITGGTRGEEGEEKGGKEGGMNE